MREGVRFFTSLRRAPPPARSNSTLLPGVMLSARRPRRRAACEPGDGDARIHDQRHYSLPSSINLPRSTLRGRRQVLLNSTILSIASDRSQRFERPFPSGTTRATAVPRLVITVCFPCSALLTTSENRALASNTLSLSMLAVG